MTNRPKKLGTANESRLRDELLEAGVTAARLAEGGVYDEGDVRAILAGDLEVYVECKYGTQVTVRTVLERQAYKTPAGNGTTRLPAVQWHRIVRTDTPRRRGLGRIVVMEHDAFVLMWTRAGSPMMTWLTAERLTAPEFHKLIGNDQLHTIVEWVRPGAPRLVAVSQAVFVDWCHRVVTNDDL